ncbi:hypothetical protein [Paenibacillus sp. IHBB 10380]|uniref:hypothetical protein n=1 Tax=Paenibacillus sp. IHBB 10380 TaxID=1566358 RepID=UPI0005CFAC30|nr:hypothetical protein [Paenibacillus sp. IHBB 10380]AJS58128.1 hypothetical protein UB51_06020 [Paenibacillus sp. IHBB 10380]
MFKNRSNYTNQEPLYINPTASKLPWIYSRRALIISVVLFILIITLSFRFPGSSSIIERIFAAIGLPVTSQSYGSGLHYANLVVLALFIVLLFTANYALQRGRTWIVIILLITLGTVPNWLTTNYQRYLASGIYAVEVDQNESRCFYTIDQGEFTGHCQLTLINNNNSTVEVQPLLEIPRHRTTSKNTLPDIKLKPVTLQAGETKVYRTESGHALIENYIDQGPEEGWLEVKLSNGKYDRRLKTKVY